MKKSIAWVCVLSMLVAILALGGFTVPAAVVYRDGDVNGDGNVTTYDARLLLVQILSTVTMNDAQHSAADMNNDGALNTSDVRLVVIKAIGGQSDVLTEVSLLAPTIDDWYNPVQKANQAYCTTKQTVTVEGGYTFLNVTERDEGAGGAMLNPYTWPYAAYTYDAKILAPSTAYIEYDLTVTAAAAGVALFMGGDAPGFDDAYNPHYMTLNEFITDNLDAESGDILPGTYQGTVAVADLIASGAVPDECRPSGHLWLSGIKVYVVGHDDQYVTVRTLKLSAAYQDGLDVDLSTEPLLMVRPSLTDPSETKGLATITGMELYENGYRTAATSVGAAADTKKIYHTLQEQRVVNYPDGYRIDIPSGWKPDYSLSALRSRYTSDDSVLTVSKESTTYANTLERWEVFLSEWIERYIGDEFFLSNNYMRYLRAPVVSETMLEGYTVLTYDMAIDWQGNMEMPHYSIAIIRKFYTYDTFYLMVLKSKAPTDSTIDRIIRSFAEVSVRGAALNTQGQYARVEPSNWSDETRAYYNKLVTQEDTDWGFFSYSMLETSNENYATRRDQIQSERQRLESSMNMTYDIMPTYTHLAFGSQFNAFPLDMANEFAGGNGFNGKPVLQFTYQYTLTNNQKLNGPTPVFNVLRGDYDSRFRQLARDIKAYGKPVLFRLNNEMNADWTSYCGLVSLLDPDIFVLGWQHLYDIFEEEGVDNCIWIFNPYTPTYPPSAWNDPLCYMPGEEYVQVLGLTNYAMGNDTTVASFQQMYTDVYEINKDYFMNYPWVISEFACGAGGERQFNWNTNAWQTTTLGRNMYAQYTWIVGMFNCLNNRQSTYYNYEFCKNIKGAVWFNCNDYTTIDGTDYVTNYLKIEESSSWAISAFKSGFAAR